MSILHAFYTKPLFNDLIFYSIFYYCVRVLYPGISQAAAFPGPPWADPLQIAAKVEETPGKYISPEQHVDTDLSGSFFMTWLFYVAWSHFFKILLHVQESELLESQIYSWERNHDNEIPIETIPHQLVLHRTKSRWQRVFTPPNGFCSVLSTEWVFGTSTTKQTLSDIFVYIYSRMWVQTHPYTSLDCDAFIS